MTTKLSDALQKLTKAVSSLEAWEGGPRGHNTRRKAVQAALSAARAALDEERPHQQTRKPKKRAKRRSDQQIHADMRAEGWKPIRFDVWQRYGRTLSAKRAGGVVWVRDWELTIARHHGPSAVLRARKSKQERAALLAEVTLASL